MNWALIKIFLVGFLSAHVLFCSLKVYCGTRDVTHSEKLFIYHYKFFYPEKEAKGFLFNVTTFCLTLYLVYKRWTAMHLLQLTTSNLNCSALKKQKT